MSVRPHLLPLVVAALLSVWPLHAKAGDGLARTPPPPVDPLVVAGRLDNGFRYAVRPQPVPPGRLSFFLLVETGSANEGEAEGGYAHFVEHMAFTGTRDFPGDAGIRTLQRF